MYEQFLIRLYFLKKRHNAQKKNNVFMEVNLQRIFEYIVNFLKVKQNSCTLTSFGIF